jgi:hypothetical protein
MFKEVEDWFAAHTVDLTFPGFDHHGRKYSALQKRIEACVRKVESENVGGGVERRNQIKEEAVGIARAIVDAMQTYFEGTIAVKLATDIRLYQACRLMNPIKMRELQLSATEFESVLKNLKDLLSTMTT